MTRNLAGIGIFFVGVLAAACSGGGDAPELNALGKLLDGNVFAFGQDHTSSDPLQQLKGEPKKTLVYFENTSDGMRYLKVVMNLQSLGFDAFAGTLSFGDGDTVTFDDKHLCHYSEQTSTQLRGGTIETIWQQVSGCAAPTTGPETYALANEIVRERLTLYDAAKGVALTRLYRTMPASVDAAARPLLGVYQLTGSFYCTPATPAAYAQLYAAPSGQLRYTALREQATGNGIEEGTFSVSGTSVTFTPEYTGVCATSALMPTEAPVFPLNIRTADKACSAAQKSAPYTFQFQLLDVTSPCTTFLKELRLTGSGQVAPYMRGPLVFPATSGNGAHYLWGVLSGK